MPTRSAYPTDSDISTFVTNSGVVLPSGYVFTGFGALASQWWEDSTGYLPFLQSVSAYDMRFNPPGTQPVNRAAGNQNWGGGTVLNLNAGIPNIASFNSVVIQNSTLSFTLGVNCWLNPVNNPAKGRPFTRLKFQYPVWGFAESVVINALWGWSATLPEEVWQAILRKGAELAMLDILEGIRTSFISIKQGDETFGINPTILAASGEGWRNYAEKVLNSSTYKMREWGIL